MPKPSRKNITAKIVKKIQNNPKAATFFCDTFFAQKIAPKIVSLQRRRNCQYLRYVYNMGRIDQQTVQKILDTADIVEVVSDFVKLRRSGANYKGLCPFHNERTPSFSVNKARNICKCFSCGKGGSPVNFIMEHEQLSYSDALRYLARKYGIEIVEKEMTDEEKRQQNEREAMLAVNEFALNHFRYNLLETDEGRAVAMPYFRHRGLSDAMIKRFHLGYAIDRSDDLINAAVKAGFDTRYLVSTGLAGVSQRQDSGQSLYDRYRGRVIFPIHSVSGRVVGFGARTMRQDKNIAKYVNSPESTIYKKNLELYGFYQAKSAIARADKCIMVEGYLDVISMHQAGVENVVASSGTSLTEGQIRAVRRFSDNVTLIYDADAAGIKASLRGIHLLLAEKMNVKVLSLPPGDDPDSFAQSHSSSQVEEFLRNHETDIISFMTNVLMGDIDPSDPSARAKTINIILETVACVDEPVKRQEYLTVCSRTLGLSEEVLLRQLNIFITRRYEENYKEQQRQAARASLPARDNAVTGESTAAQPDGESKADADTPPQAAEAPLLDLTDSHLRPYERMLARYLVRYGVCYLADITDADGNISQATVYDLIANELSIDGINFTDPGCAAIFNAVGTIRRDSWPPARQAHSAEVDASIAQELDSRRAELAQRGGSLAQLEREESKLMEQAATERAQQLDEFDAAFVRDRLINSPDDNIRKISNELAAEKYTLSRIYTRQANVETEEQQLRTLVPRAVNELRAAIVRDIMADLNAKLAALPPENTDDATGIMQQIVAYKEYEKRLVKALGERIILPPA